ncbi:MAG: aquaporin family protein [Oscillospiraceae bacterium]|nr:aquaporin family protein [Oscillospiraceae bacterium]
MISNVYLAEFFGSAMLVFLGDGVVANTLLSKSAFRNSGPIFITLGWGLALMLPVTIFGGISAVFNPSFSIALALTGGLTWGVAIGQVIAQMLGGMVGAFFVWVAYLDQFDGSDDPGTIRAVFCTAPAVRHYIVNLIEEILITFTLIFFILGFSQVPDSHAMVNGVVGAPNGVFSFFIFAILTGIGMSFGGITAYGLNPCRDLAPRIMHAILPIKGKGKSDWAYSWVPVLGSLIGATLACVVYNVFPW